MTREEAVRKLEYSKKAYQMLIDEKVDSGKFVGKDFKGEWKADTPLDEAYKSMIDALEIAIKALEQEPKTGHWRAVYQGDEIINYRCSECEFGNTFGKRPYGMYYCPNCGVKMIEPQESEEV